MVQWRRTKLRPFLPLDLDSSSMFIEFLAISCTAKKLLVAMQTFQL